MRLKTVRLVVMLALVILFDGSLEQLPQLAEELVRLQVDVLLVPNVPAALAAKPATTTIPLVMVAVSDPVGSGLIASLARPDGNITGLATLDPELIGKQLEFLKDVLPTVSRWPSSGIPTISSTPARCGWRTWWPRR